MGFRNRWQDQQRLVRTFRDVGALIPERSRTLASLGLEPGPGFLALVRRGVLAGDARTGYYLDEGAWMRQKLNAAKWAMSALMLALLLLGLLLFGRS